MLAGPNEKKKRKNIYIYINNAPLRVHLALISGFLDLSRPEIISVCVEKRDVTKITAHELKLFNNGEKRNRSSVTSSTSAFPVLW